MRLQYEPGDGDTKMAATVAASMATDTDATHHGDLGPPMVSRPSTPPLTQWQPELGTPAGSTTGSSGISYMSAYDELEMEEGLSSYFTCFS